MPQPVYLYYGFTNYYQNHRRYLKFFSPDQMNGRTIDETTVKQLLLRQLKLVGIMLTRINK